MKPAIDIGKFLKGLSSMLFNNGIELGIVQFGSSLDFQQLSNGLDIDLMLLSSIDRYNGDFSRQLSELKQKMVLGQFSKGFEHQDINLKKMVTDYLADQKHPGINFIPRFIFGPIETPLSTDQNFNVYLHFKGPITINQFLEFADLFPFHARSILKRSKSFVNDFDLRLIILPDVHINREFKVFSDALALRVSSTRNPIVMRKCLRKLMQNLNVLDDINFLSGTEVLEQLQGRFDLCFNRPLDAENLKRSFYELKETSDKLCKTALSNIYH